MRLTIDSIDFSSYLTKYGYTTSYRKILGSNNIVTLDGTSHEDLLALKTDVSVPLKPLTSSQLSSLLKACKKDTVTAVFFDLDANTYVSKTMRPMLSEATIAMDKFSELWWNGGSGGIVLTLEEK